MPESFAADLIEASLGTFLQIIEPFYGVLGILTAGLLVVVIVNVIVRRS